MILPLGFLFFMLVARCHSSLKWAQTSLWLQKDQKWAELPNHFPFFGLRVSPDLDQGGT